MMKHRIAFPGDSDYYDPDVLQMVPYVTYIPIPERTCETCQHHDADALRCKSKDNPTPDEPAYPSDSCHGWERKEKP
jgi:hypothetical protein